MPYTTTFQLGAQLRTKLSLKLCLNVQYRGNVYAAHRRCDEAMCAAVNEHDRWHCTCCRLCSGLRLKANAAAIESNVSV